MYAQISMSVLVTTEAVNILAPIPMDRLNAAVEKALYWALMDCYALVSNSYPNAFQHMQN